MNSALCVVHVLPPLCRRLDGGKSHLPELRLDELHQFR
jgi:hypothetical protein